jgi:serine/threonine protein kinase/tetratricopeptide (TPR) repeat protein
MNSAQADPKAIFLEALECDGPDAVRRHLDQACGADVGLRSRVEELLRAHQDAGRFLGGAESPPAAEQPGTIIGPYKLLEQIGEGGMGLVFMAEQTQPIRRKVALKILKPGMDTRQVVARFEAERQALALMDHPNIAKILDAGAIGVRGWGLGVSERQEPDSSALTPNPQPLTPTEGRPYFVMELVKGVPITEFCDQHRLNPRQRLDVFVQVCHAVQHAHQKGIIHRDLKPTNVLVTLHDTVPVPKVIDFGIAKAVGQQLTEKTLFTHFAQMVGTPLYMSPEQAEMNGLDVDTRSDVYALGVLLYELLTGTTPFEAETLKKVGLDEMRRLIREEDPPRPSHRVSTLANEACSTVSDRRGVDGRRLPEMLRGELDWIVMKSLEKDRERRYESAGALAADVQRYLDDEPVEACPPTRAYRLRKFSRRNWRALVTAGIVAASLVTATSVSAWQAVIAREAQRQAELDRDRAAEAEALATAINDFLQRDLLSQVDPHFQIEHRYDPNLTVRQALDRAAARIGDRFPDKPLLEAAVRLTIGKAYRGVDQKQSLIHFERSAALRKTHLGADHPDTLTSQFFMARTYCGVGRTRDALDLLGRVLEQRRSVLGADDPTTLMTMGVLGETHFQAGQMDQAERMIQAAVDKMHRTLGPNHRYTANALHDLGCVYASQRRYTEAIQTLDTATKRLEIAYGRAYCDTIESLANLSRAYDSAGMLEDAERVWVERSNRMTQKDPNDSYLAELRLRLGCKLLDQGNATQAERPLKQALQFYEKFQPNEVMRHHGTCLLGEVYLHQGKYAAAEVALLKGYEGMARRKASSQEDALRLSRASGAIIRLYEATNEPEKARRWREDKQGK